MFGLGIGELLVVGLLVLLFFGGNRLPKLGSSLGMALHNFKAGLKAGGENAKITTVTDNKKDS
ncbi:MAG: twin-arginine translocase TatA/TatE family subunit [Bacteriovoracaceae bacterium]